MLADWAYMSYPGKLNTVDDCPVILQAHDSSYYIIGFVLS